MYTIIRRIIPVALVLLFGSVGLAQAQNASVYFGLGTARDGSNNQSLDDGDPSDFGPSMGGVFINIGGDVMFRPTLGFGAEYSARATQADYAPQVSLNYRPVFYDFNAIWHPVGSNTRIVPEFQGGLGGADLKFYASETGCAIAGVCTTINQYIASSDHFQLHFSGGVRFYVKPSIFIRPQVDVHWVHNFQEFGSDWAPEYSVAVGFTFGQH